MKLDVEARRCRDEVGDGAATRQQLIDVGLGKLHILGDVPGHDRDWHAALQHDLGGVRVGVHVELAERRGVAIGAQGAPHKEALAHRPGQARLLAQRQGHIGERPHSYKRHLAGGRHDLTDQQIYGVLGHGLGGGAWERSVAQALVAVGIERGVERPQQWPVAAAGDRQRGRTAELQHGQGVDHTVGERAVAVDDAEANEVDLGRGKGEQNGESVVDARICVQQNTPGGGRGHERSPR